MKILIVIWSIQIGGAETFALQLCKYLKARGYEPFLFPVFGPWDMAYYESISSLNVTILSPFRNRLFSWLVWKINAASQRAMLGNFREWVNARYFKRLIDDYSIQLVISNANAADLFVFKNLKGTRPYIVIEHGDYSLAITDKLNISWDGLNGATEIVCVSRWCKNMISKKNIVKPITVIYNGHARASCHTPQVTNKKDQRKSFTFCLIGRGIELKGWEEAIQSFLLVRMKYRDIRLVLIGHGEHLNHLKTQHEGDTSIHFTGNLTYPLEVIKNVDVGLVPTRRAEAFGISILDFFSLGKPVIATDVGGIPEVINYGNKKGGVLVPVDKNGRAIIADLSKEMIAMIENREDYRKASEHAAEIYQTFNFNRTAAQYEEVIKRCLS